MILTKEKYHPYKEETDDLIELIKQSKIIACTITEYTYNPIIENGKVDVEEQVPTGHKEITFHIQQYFRSKTLSLGNQLAITKKD